MATATMPTPSASAEMPNVKCVWPDAMSVPMTPRKSPNTTMATERSTEPCASTMPPCQTPRAQNSRALRAPAAARKGPPRP
jgi:hypothetical protein